MTRWRSRVRVPSRPLDKALIGAILIGAFVCPGPSAFRVLEAHRRRSPGSRGTRCRSRPAEPLDGRASRPGSSCRRCTRSGSPSEARGWHARHPRRCPRHLPGSQRLSVELPDCSTSCARCIGTAILTAARRRDELHRGCRSHADQLAHRRCRRLAPPKYLSAVRARTSRRSAR